MRWMRSGDRTTCCVNYTGLFQLRSQQVQIINRCQAAFFFFLNMSQSASVVPARWLEYCYNSGNFQQIVVQGQQPPAHRQQREDSFSWLNESINWFISNRCMNTRPRTQRWWNDPAVMERCLCGYTADKSQYLALVNAFADLHLNTNYKTYQYVHKRKGESEVTQHTFLDIMVKVLPFLFLFVCFSDFHFRRTLFCLRICCKRLCNLGQQTELGS